MSSSSGLNQDVAELEEALKQLRIEYEKYFAGVERVEPAKQREALRKQILRLVGENTRNTARRFRAQTLQASLVTYEQHWNRITRQIEEGTFKRDRLKAARLAAPPPRSGLLEELEPLEPEALDPAAFEPEPEGLGGPGLEESGDGLAGPEDVRQRARPGAPGLEDAREPTGREPPPGAPASPRAAGPAASRSALDDIDEVLALAGELTRRPAADPATGPRTSPSPSPRSGSARTAATAAREPDRPAPSRAAAAAPVARPAGPGARAAAPAAPPGGLSAELRALHRAYLTSREALGEREPVPLDAFAATLDKQAAAIKQRLKCRDVEFKVAVKDGKTILKATPRS